LVKDKEAIVLKLIKDDHQIEIVNEEKHQLELINSKILAQESDLKKLNVQ